MRTTPVALRLGLAALAALTLGPAPRAALAHPSPLDHLSGGPNAFFTVSDGTSIAMNICFPPGYDPANPGARTYPAILEMAGYENGSSSCSGRTTLGQLRDWFAEQSGSDPSDPPLAEDSHAGTTANRFDREYVVVHASLRGTGCSGGEFDLFSSRSAMDGYEIIERFLVTQPWSNGKVAIVGHSYSGITGTFVAETAPPHLVAVSVSGLIDDLYRGITYPGGVFNGLFPPLWTLGVRPAYDVLGGSVQGILRNIDDPAIAAQCAANIATHRRAVVQDPVLHGLSQTDNDWWRARSLITNAGRIRAPIMMTGAFQDEQTGPRFPHLWEAVPPGVPKRLLLLNGNHGAQVDVEEVWRDRKAWIDFWTGVDTANPYVDPATTPVSVRTLLEVHRGPGGALQSNSALDSTSFPLAETRWTPWFFSAGGALVEDRSAIVAGEATYLSGTKRQSWSSDAGPPAGQPLTTATGPDEAEFRSAPFAEATVVDGPITANLFLATTATDTDLFVQVLDEFPDGQQAWVLQRGLLRASHAAIDPLRSDFFGTDPLTGGPFLYRPFRPHTNPQPVTPGVVNEYLVEVFPVAHVFRPGHRLVVKVMAPPAVDAEYSYTPGAPPVALNTVAFSADRPSRVTLPVIPGVQPAGAPLDCGAYWKVRCIQR